MEQETLREFLPIDDGEQIQIKKKIKLIENFD